MILVLLKYSTVTDWVRELSMLMFQRRISTFHTFGIFLFVKKIILTRILRRCSISKSMLLCLNEQDQTELVNLTETTSASKKEFNIEVPGQRLLNVRSSPFNEKSSFIVSTADKNVLFANINQSYFDMIDSVSIKGDIYVQLLDLGASIIEIIVEPISEVNE